jgi:DNA replication protein DnaC
MADREDYNSLFADYFDTQCPDCQNSRWVVADGVARRCHCFMEHLAEHRLAFAGIPPSYQRCRLDNFILQNATQREALTFVEMFITSFQRGEALGRGLLIRGPVGVGKTHLGVGALRRLIELGFTGRFQNFLHLIEQIRQSFDEDGADIEGKLFRRLSRCQVVLLDELGATRPTEFVFNKLYDIINYCFDQRISVLFTTNYLDQAQRPGWGAGSATGTTHAVETTHPEPSGPGSAAAFTLAERITQRLYSRIMERCSDVVLQGPDYRLRHKVKG